MNTLLDFLMTAVVYAFAGSMILSITLLLLTPFFLALAEVFAWCCDTFYSIEHWLETRQAHTRTKRR